jgi:hypothetical protein
MSSIETWDDETLDYWSGSDLFAEEQEDLDAERERRENARKTEEAAEAAARRARHDRWLQTPQGRLSTLKNELKQARQTLAEMTKPSTGPQKMHPDQISDPLDPTRREYVEQAALISTLVEQVAQTEKRMQFHGKDDDTLDAMLEEAEEFYAGIKREYDELMERQRLTGHDPESTARGRRILKQFAEARAALNPIADERQARQQDRQRQALIDDLAKKDALRHRERQLEHFRNEEARLRRELDASLRPGESPHFDMSKLTNAVAQQAEIQEWMNNHPEPSKNELKWAHERLTADDRLKVVGPGTVEFHPVV